jgi:hypothetical protein
MIIKKVWWLAANASGGPGPGPGPGVPNTVMAYDLDPLNRFVDIYFNHFDEHLAAIVAGDIDLTFTQNGGTATAASVTSITDFEGNALSGVFWGVRVNLSYTGNPSGVEELIVEVNTADLSPGVNSITTLLNPTYDSDYQAVLSYAISEGYTVPIREFRTVENDWMVAYKASGAFAKDDILLRFSPYGDENYALIDWKRLITITKVQTTGKPFTRYTGFTAGGGYFDTLYTPSTDGVNYTLNDASALHVSLSNVSGTSFIDYGTAHSDANNSKRLRALTFNVNIAAYCLNSGSLSTVAGITTSIGMFLNTRNGSANTAHDVYIDGVIYDTQNAVSAGVPDQSLIIGAERIANGTITNISTRVLSFFALGSEKSGIALTLYNDENTYVAAAAAVTPEKEIWSYLLTDAIQTDDANTITTD